VPRSPDPNSKSERLVLSGKPEQSTRIRAFKEIVARNPELTINKVLMEKVDEFLRKHNWPPGNSQTVLQVFTVERKEGCQFAERKRDTQTFCGLKEYWMLESECAKCEKKVL